jgi:molybdopterin molybdotransferase
MNKKTHLISVEEATSIILGEVENFGTEEVSFDKSLGRILKEDIKADREMPPFNRVSMDGIALKTAVFEAGKRQFKIEGVQAAGKEQLTLINEENCLEAMTGAMLPIGTDAVIPYELISIDNNLATVNIDAIKHFQNIHKQGLDRKKNELLIPKNFRISSAEVGVLATVGKSKVKVAKNPKIAIISTGDELVEVDQTPQPYQIRKSNVHSLVALLKEAGIESDAYHLPDNKSTLTQKIQSLLEDYDVLMFSGAVSKGKFDYLPEVLDHLGVKKRFHKVQQRPGKPFWFGKKDKTTVFAYPGNPVSTYVSCLKYFFPWLAHSLKGEIETDNYAVLDRDFVFKPALTYFLQVRLKNERGIVTASPIAGNGSGDLANLTQNTAFMELTSNKSEFKKGAVFPIISYRR